MGAFRQVALKGVFLSPKLFKQVSAIIALVLILIFTVGWIVYLSHPPARNAGMVALLLFCGGFGVLLFIGVKLYNPPGLDGDTPPAQAEAEDKAEEQDTAEKNDN